MANTGWIHGSAVDKKTGEVRYLSSSALQLADDTTDKGCLRKWYYAYKEGRKEPQTRQQKDGEDDHACVERYLQTGDRIFRPRVAKGIHMLPPPGEGLFIEHDLIPKAFDKNGKEISGLHLAMLRAAGIPIVGRIDLMHDLGINYGADSVEDTRDPEGTVEVFDHKFVKSLDWALKGPDLLKNIQMVAYGEYVFRTIPGAKFVRLSHGYYPTIGNARKSTIRVTREPISAFWSEHVEPLARSIADAAKAPTADQVRPNPRACKAFNRLCMHAEYCSAGMQVGLAAQIGQTASKALLDALTKPTTGTMSLIPGKNLLAHINKPQADATARQAELDKLKAEEAAAKKAALPEGLFKTISKIEVIAQRNNLGWPQLKGRAAEAFTTLTGQSRAATGALENVEIADVAQFEDLLGELTTAFGDVEVTASEPATVTPEAVGLLPDDAPGAVAAPPVQETPMADIAKEADKPKAKRGKKKADVVPEETPAPRAGGAVITSVDLPPPVPLSGSQDTTATIGAYEYVQDTTTTQAVHLFVDVVTEGGNYKELAPIVDTFAELIAKRFNLDDIRTGGPDSPLGYAKWKGVLAAMIRESGIQPGAYRIDARGNEIYEEAVQAMRSVVRASGGQYVRGAR